MDKTLLAKLLRTGLDQPDAVPSLTSEQESYATMRKPADTSLIVDLVRLCLEVDAAQVACVVTRLGPINEITLTATIPSLVEQLKSFGAAIIELPEWREFARQCLAEAVRVWPPSDDATLPKYRPLTPVDSDIAGLDDFLKGASAPPPVPDHSK